MNRELSRKRRFNRPPATSELTAWAKILDQRLISHDFLRPNFQMLAGFLAGVEPDYERLGI